MKQLWLNIILRRPWLVLLIGFTLIAGASMGAKNLYFRGDYKVFFEDDNPERLAYEELQNVFSKNENVNIIIAPHSKSVFNPNTISLIKELTDEAWQIPMSTRVDSIANFQHTWADEDDLIVEDLISSLKDIDATSIAKAKEVALVEPNLVHRLISPNGEVAVISIIVNMPDDDKTAAVAEIVNYSRQLTDKYKLKYPEHDFYHTGIVFMNNSFASEAQKDAESLVPMMFLAIVLVLWILLRSFFATMATVVVIITAIATTMGLAGWMGFFLSTATVNVPTLVMTLAVADCVHVIASMTYALRQGKTKQEALLVSMELNLMPIFITSATTAVGFLTLNFANVPILADLGNLTAIGVGLAFIFSVTLLPAMLMLVPISIPKLDNEDSGKMEKFGEWVIKHHRRILPFTMLLVLGAIAGSMMNNINDVATEYFDDSTAFRRSTDFQEKNISGMSSIDFALFTEQESGVNDPQLLGALQDFVIWLREQPEVDHVISISDTFKRLNKNMHGDDESYYVLPNERDLAAQYLLMYEMSLPYGLDLNNQLNIDKSATRVMVTMQNLGSKEFTEFEQRAQTWLTGHSPQYKLTAGSPSLMFAHIGETNMYSMIRGTILAMVLISLLLVFALRSWRMGLISLIPNLLPALIGFGIWGIYSGQINLGLSIVLSMALGIIVDDTVHFLSKYRHSRVQGNDAEQAVRYAFTSVGRALWITTLVLTMGFSVLAMSSFALNADMGLLTAIIIVVALAVDFFFLPAFLIVFDNQISSEGSKHASA